MRNCCGVPADGKTQTPPRGPPDPDDLVRSRPVDPVRSRPVDLVRSPPVHGMNEYIDGLVAAVEVAAPAPPPAAAAPTDEEKLAQAVCGKDFTFAGQRFLAKIVDYYDGDTVRVAFPYGGQIIQYKARMAGYNSPEMKPLKSNPNREAEKAAAIAARAALIGKVGGALVYIECGEFDKYGRLLVTVHLRDGHDNGENVNAWMIAHGYGAPYDGGNKTPFAGAD